MGTVSMQNLAQVQMTTIVALILFSIIMVLVGFYATKRAKTVEGFLLGGRKIGAWISAFAYGTTYFSAVIFIGYAGKHGWDIGYASIWIGVGNAILGSLIAWLILAKRTRGMTHRLGAKTMPEFFEGRYGSTAMKVYSALIIFVFLVPYSAAVYKGLGSLFVTIFPGADIMIVMSIVAILTAIYLVFGGYVATAYNDFIQGVIMIAGAVVMVFAITYNPAVGGFSTGFAKIKALGDAAGNTSLTNWFGGSNWKFLAYNIMLTSFGTWGLPQMIMKYYAIKDEKSIKQATVISTSFALIIGVSAYYVGVLGRIFVPIAEKGMPKDGFDMVVPQILMQALGNDGSLITTIILAVIMLLLLSASMSTLAGVVLTSSSAISVDLLPVVHPNIKEQHKVTALRLLCLLFVAASFLFAVTNITFIVNLMSFSWGIVSGCFIGPFIWGLYYKKTTKAGAWAGLISGLVTVVALTTIYTITSGDFKVAMSMSPQFGVCAMVVSVVIVPVVSLLTKSVPVDHIKSSFGIETGGR
ncbi:MAG: Sodium/proline symporter [Firmicutes bacterium ADurb.Bin193]|nr:MAG: Sodium/proline symporter [Firmicutes bacterium ADurb.Bin193]